MRNMNKDFYKYSQKYPDCVLLIFIIIIKFFLELLIILTDKFLLVIDYSYFENI